jgi:VWFA-related protein
VFRWPPLFAFLTFFSVAHSQSPPATAAPSEQNPAASNDPILRRRPDEKPRTPPGPRRTRLDVVVTDAAGQPVTGLEPWDFKLTDNGKPSKILYFRALHPAASRPDPSLQVLLVLDALNSNSQEQVVARDEAIRYLRQNNGRLGHPVTLMVLTDKGLEVQPRPSADGKREVKLLEKLGPRISVFSPAMGFDGEIERLNLSLGQVRMIAENQTHKPGRKVLVWVGSGWPILETRSIFTSTVDRSRYFDDVVSLSNWLIDGRTVICTVSPLDSTAGAALTNTESYKAFLTPVLQSPDATSGTLALQVLAIQSGGRVLGPGSDLAEQINQCAGEADVSYELTFEPAGGQAPAIYHSLKLTVDRPGLVVRTRSGYYSQP